MSEIIVRKIIAADLSNGFLESLDALKKTSNMDRKRAFSILEKISQNPNHVIFVAVYNDKVVGATTLLIEQKFIHDGGKVGHIEDVAISKEFQSIGIGVMIIKEVLEYAKNQGCYKTILDCDEQVKPFYEKIGFSRHSNGMRFNH
ncbi:MAG TPA: GNAT family N-acetyltransferase [Candidatus Nitrosotenuis sp.]|jgi:glucosamine-phosphate N-acetyltransferase|nr:GNAT family N-acetyltransferase [Candidatus Nitrosotenuis sp.]HIH68686.1 GNAT family N-acetyltransferase [Candidatus Nitrosotenuis sp.]